MKAEKKYGYKWQTGYYFIRPDWRDKFNKICPFFYSAIVRVSPGGCFDGCVSWHFKNMRDEHCSYTYVALIESEINILRGALVPLEDIYWENSGGEYYRLIPILDLTFKDIKVVKYYNDRRYITLFDWDELRNCGFYNWKGWKFNEMEI